MRQTIRRTALAGVTAALTLALTACNGSDDDPDGDPSTSTSDDSSPVSTTPSESATPKTDAEKAQAALERFLEYRDDAYHTLKLDEGLNKVATGHAHYSLQGEVLNQKDNGITIRGEYVHELRNPRRTGDAYMVPECEDRSAVSATQDGTPIKELGPDGKTELPNPFLRLYTVKKVKSRWLVDSYDVPKNWKKPC